MSLYRLPQEVKDAMVVLRDMPPVKSVPVEKATIKIETSDDIRIKKSYYDIVQGPSSVDNFFCSLIISVPVCITRYIENQTHIWNISSDLTEGTQQRISEVFFILNHMINIVLTGLQTTSLADLQFVMTRLSIRLFSVLYESAKQEVDHTTWAIDFCNAVEQLSHRGYTKQTNFDADLFEFPIENPEVYHTLPAIALIHGMFSRYDKYDLFAYDALFTKLQQSASSCILPVFTHPPHYEQLQYFQSIYTDKNEKDITGIHFNLTSADCYKQAHNEYIAHKLNNRMMDFHLLKAVLGSLPNLPVQYKSKFNTIAQQIAYSPLPSLPAVSDILASISMLLTLPRLCEIIEQFSESTEEEIYDSLYDNGVIWSPIILLQIAMEKQGVSHAGILANKLMNALHLLRADLEFPDTNADSCLFLEDTSAVLPEQPMTTATIMRMRNTLDTTRIVEDVALPPIIRLRDNLTREPILNYREHLLGSCVNNTKIASHIKDTMITDILLASKKYTHDTSLALAIVSVLNGMTSKGADIIDGAEMLVKLESHTSFQALLSQQKEDTLQIPTLLNFINALGQIEQHKPLTTDLIIKTVNDIFSNPFTKQTLACLHNLENLLFTLYTNTAQVINDMQQSKTTFHFTGKYIGLLLNLKMMRFEPPLSLQIRPQLDKQVDTPLPTDSLFLSDINKARLLRELGVL